MSSGSSCRTSSSSGGGSEVFSPGRSRVPLYKPVADHLPRNCEACMLGRCPRPTRCHNCHMQRCRGRLYTFQFQDVSSFLTDSTSLLGRRQECNNFIHFIQWALLDSSGEPYYLMYLVIDIKQMRENIIVKFGAHFEDFSALGPLDSIQQVAC